jgi:ribosome maturation factor RimP
MTVADDAREVVEGAVATLDADLYDVEFTGGVLRVTLDRPDGIGLDDLAEANRAISRALDDADPIPGHYTLEVSSPGLERSLRLPAHWAAAVGERVKVKTTSEVDGLRRFDGVVESVGTGTVTIKDGAGARHEVPLDEVDRARTVFEWGGQPKPSAGRTR